MKFELSVLGSGSALPRLDRKPSAQLLNLNEKYFLIDCGEGTQLELKRYGFKFQRISHIFISHLHGDHYLGLPGLIATFHLLGREKELCVHAPPELQDILHYNMERTGTELRFPIRFEPTDGNVAQRILEEEDLEVHSIPLFHRTHCTGFHFQEKPKKRKIRKEKLAVYDIPIRERPKLKEGMDVLDRNGVAVPCEELTDPAPPAYSYAYFSDTAYRQGTAEQIRNVDLLYHDATFLEEEKERAAKTFHSTASQAAQAAKDANAGRLLLGHFSARYRELTPFLKEAEKVFPNVLLAKDGLRIRVDRPDLLPGSMN